MIIPILFSRTHCSVCALSVSLGDCGGSLIGPKVVLSATHCNRNLRVGASVWVGGTGKDTTAGGGQERTIAGWVHHAEYQEGEEGGVGKEAYDAGLVYLDEAVDPNTDIDFELASSIPSPGTTLTVVGVGIFDNSEVQTNEVRKVGVKAISSASCNADDGYKGDIVYPLNFCAVKHLVWC